MAKDLSLHTAESDHQTDSFKRLLRFYRERAGLRQRDLQVRLATCGYIVSETTISMWENGERLPSDPTLFHHLRHCLSLSEAQERSLMLKCVLELNFRYLEPYINLTMELDAGWAAFWDEFFGAF